MKKNYLYAGVAILLCSTIATISKLLLDIIKFMPLYVSIILREQIFCRKSRKGEAIYGYLRKIR